jgi:hypothetical protein
VTIEELNKDLEQAVTDLKTVYASFYLCCTDLKDAMQERIFVNSLGTNGQSLPTVPYGTKPLYFDTDNTVKSFASFQVGKTGKKIKSAYFPNGYAQLKQASGKPPLELSNNLAADFKDSPQVDDFNTVKIVVSENNVEKIGWLEKKYGEIFFPTDDELNELVLCLEEKANETLER